jgi:hypothetical protein
LGDGGTVRKLVVATTAGADDAMPARREKAIFGFTVGVGVGATIATSRISGIV